MMRSWEFAVGSLKASATVTMADIDSCATLAISSAKRLALLTIWPVSGTPKALEFMYNAQATRLDFWYVTARIVRRPEKSC